VKRSVTAYWLGRVPYERAHSLQRALVTARIQGRVGDVILLLEHDPVVTLGRGAKESNILAGDEDLRARGVAIAETGRGGDVTFHGPGQLVAYPIIDLKPDRCDVRKYVRDLAEVMIGLASDHGISAGVLPGDPKFVGVWVDESSPKVWDEERALAASRLASFPTRAGIPALPASRGEAFFPAAREGHLPAHSALRESPPMPRLAKIGAIGVRLSRWVTMHGFAFNVATDLSGFRLIVPCGIQTLGVASLATLGVEPPSLDEVSRASLPHFSRVFDADVVLGDADLDRFLEGVGDAGTVVEP
jgi:lipoyl(octanoyl) transferase